MSEQRFSVASSNTPLKLTAAGFRFTSGKSIAMSEYTPCDYI
jgi:hypothetical protein